MKKFDELCALLHGPNYGLGQADNPAERVEGWGGLDPLFSLLIERVRPSLIIEVGSWKGMSAITMAKAVNRFGLSCSIICVDTWLGSPEHSSEPMLDLTNGYNALYNAFRTNVLNAGLERTIIPYAAPSTVAAQVFAHKGLLGDLVYIDASHDYMSVRNDLKSYYNLLSRRGIIFGDDYYSQFPGVIRAVEEFREEVGLDVAVSNGKWILGRDSAELSTYIPDPVKGAV